MYEGEKNHNFEINFPLDKLDKEVEFSFARSGGKGGQNVNKRSTKATVRWNYKESEIPDDHQKLLIETRLKNRINDKNEVVVSSSNERSQLQNRNNALQNLKSYIEFALDIDTERVETKVPRKEKEERIKEKKQKSRIKDLRKKVDFGGSE